MRLATGPFSSTRGGGGEKIAKTKEAAEPRRGVKEGEEKEGQAGEIRKLFYRYEITTEEKQDKKQVKKKSVQF